ncbi:MAG: hypothetical protein ACKO4A_11870 [Gammaproteobacteria bacterium]
MAINPVSQAGLQGFQDSLTRAQDAAQRIAAQSLPVSPPAPGAPPAANPPAAQEADDTDFAGAVVDLRAAELQARASARVIEAGEESLGTLIDIRA